MNDDATRRGFLSGVAAMTVPGGNPPMRPDQELQPRSRAGAGPAPSTNIFSRVIVAGGSGFVGVFLYSPRPGAGHLVASSAAAPGTDPFGNAYLAGQVSYSPSNLGVNYAVAISGNSLEFFTGPSASSGAGPWTLIASMELDITGTILQMNLPAAGFQLAGGLTTIGSGLLAQAGAGQTVATLSPDVAATLALAVDLAADTFTRFTINGNGRMEWGSGAAAHDVVLLRGAANVLRVLVADFDIATAGRGLQVAEGANAKQGTATLTAGTVIVANTAVTANSRIFLTAQDNNSTGALRVSARTAATSFTITSSNAADTGVVAFEIFEPG